MIRYKKGNYKYRLVETYTVQTPIYPDEDIETKYISLSTAGQLTLRDSYAWDGPSGPTIDTPNFIISSAPHDAEFQLMRMGLLDPAIWKDVADRFLQHMFVEQWMMAHPKPTGRIKRGVYNARLAGVKMRSRWVYVGVKFGGRRAATGPEKPVLTAP